MNTSVVFSIVVPVHNVAPYIRECLDSVLSQNFGQWELICIDDGSTDESGQILDTYAEGDDRISVWHQENKGVAAARNNGLEHARGEWILFLDGDDVYNPILLQQLVHAAELYPKVSLLKFDFRSFADGKGVGFQDNANFACKEVSVSSHVDNSFCWAFWAKAYRRELIRGMRFENYAHGEDVLFLMTALTRTDSVACLDVRGYGYRIRAGSAMSEAFCNRKRFIDRLGVSCGVLKLCQESGRIYSRAMYRIHLVALTQVYVFSLCRMPKSARSELWELWYQGISRLAYQKGFPVWHYLVVVICAMVKVKPLAVLLCAGPYLAKRVLSRILHMI